MKGHPRRRRVEAVAVSDHGVSGADLEGLRGGHAQGGGPTVRLGHRQGTGSPPPSPVWTCFARLATHSASALLSVVCKPEVPGTDRRGSRGPQERQACRPRGVESSSPGPAQGSTTNPCAVRRTAHEKGRWRSCLVAPAAHGSPRTTPGEGPRTTVAQLYGVGKRGAQRKAPTCKGGQAGAFNLELTDTLRSTLRSRC